MFFTNHYQNGYITRDLDRSKTMVGERCGIADWVLFDPAEMSVATPQGERVYRARIAMGWSGTLQLELIEPLNDDTCELYRDALAPDPSDAAPRFHHVAVRRATPAALDAEVAGLGLPLLMSGEVPGFRFHYIDLRSQLGHHVEMAWASEDMWRYNRWPANKPLD